MPIPRVQGGIGIQNLFFNGWHHAECRRQQAEWRDGFAKDDGTQKLAFYRAMGWDNVAPRALI